MLFASNPSVCDSVLMLRLTELLHHPILYLQSAVNLVQELRSKGAPVKGIGVTLKLTAPISIPEFLYRLDRLAEASVPIWIVDYSFSGNSSTAVKANMLSDLMQAALR